MQRYNEVGEVPEWAKELVQKKERVRENKVCFVNLSFINYMLFLQCASHIFMAALSKLIQPYGYFGTKAIALPGPPEDFSSFKGRKTKYDPLMGSLSRLARHSI